MACILEVQIGRRNAICVDQTFWWMHFFNWLNFCHRFPAYSSGLKITNKKTDNKSEKKDSYLSANNSPRHNARAYDSRTGKTELYEKLMEDTRDFVFETAFKLREFSMCLV